MSKGTWLVLAVWGIGVVAVLLQPGPGRPELHEVVCSGETYLIPLPAGRSEAVYEAYGEQYCQRLRKEEEF